MEILLVDSTKFLGIHLDSCLNCNLHTSNLISNLILNRCKGAEWLVGVVECDVTFVGYNSGSPSVVEQ